MKTYSDLSNFPSQALQRYNVHGQTMGTQYTAIFFTTPGADEATINARLFSAVNTVDEQMSSWKANSDLNRLNKATVGQWLPIPQELSDVLEAALLVSRQSQGAFDIGVGDLVHAWGFGPSAGQIDEQRILAMKAQARQLATEVLEIDPANLKVRKHAAITLDLSGIAKGYGVDQMARALDALGITRYLVGIDGEMRARGTKPDNCPWSIAIERPVRHRREVMGVMELSDAAIASSGDYRHWVEYGGKIYSHTVNGASRAPSSNKLAAISVVATSCMMADAWATALLVLGEIKGIELAQEHGMDVLFVLHDGDDFHQVPIVAGQIQS